MQSLKWSKHGLRKKNKEGQNDVSLTAATAFISKTRCHFYKPHSDESTVKHQLELEVT